MSANSSRNIFVTSTDVHKWQLPAAAKPARSFKRQTYWQGYVLLAVLTAAAVKVVMVLISLGAF